MTIKLKTINKDEIPSRGGGNRSPRTSKYVPLVEALKALPVGEYAEFDLDSDDPNAKFGKIIASAKFSPSLGTKDDFDVIRRGSKILVAYVGQR